ncbi:MAG: FAD-dependent oxidoreductase [Halanaerobiaceae bacterium]
MFRYKLTKKYKYSFCILIILLSLFIVQVDKVFAAEYNEKIEVSEINQHENFSLVVYGGEPEGVTAAISAAREGIKTLLVLNRNKPGGLMTYGGLNFLDINNSPDGTNLNNGIFEEWHKKVGGKTTFSIEKATDVFEEMLAAEENITIYRDTKLLEIIKNDDSIESLVIRTTEGAKMVSAEIFVDASQDADLSVMADVPYFFGGADIGLPDRYMAVTLVMHLGNIDWSELAVDVRSNKFGPSYINKDNAWGLVEIGQQYRPNDSNTKLRGLNIVIEEKREKSEVYINALLIFGANPIDLDSLKNAYQRGKEEAIHVVEFLRNNLGGFQEAEILSYPEELYVRESRHIISRKQLKVEDIFNNRVPDDTIAFASYPLDYQASTPKYNGFVLFNPDIYGISLRTIVPENIENLFVVGRSSGYSSLAAASARVLPTGMATAEAAGLTASYAIKKNISISDIIDDKHLITTIQQRLALNSISEEYSEYIGRNLVLKEEPEDNLITKFINLSSKTKNKLDLYPVKELKNHLEYLLSWGLIVGGYDNNFRLNQEISEKEFSHIIVKGLQQQDASILYDWVPGGMETMSSSNVLTRDRAAMLLMVAISKRISEIKKEDYFSSAVEYGIIDNYISENIKENRKLLRAEAYILISSFLQQFQAADELKKIRGDL